MMRMQVGNCRLKKLSGARNAVQLAPLWHVSNHRSGYIGNSIYLNNNTAAMHA